MFMALHTGGSACHFAVQTNSAMLCALMPCRRMHDTERFRFRYTLEE
jgi:hypothetical protein